MKIYWLLFCCAFAFADQSQHHEYPQVQSQAGTFRGSILETYFGKKIYSFRGIPYAEAPIDQNRFKAPIPVKPFNEVFNATEDGPSCPQPDWTARIMSEKCLHLNVYTTKLPQNSSQSNPNRPVIVFMHPGANLAFSGASHDLGPQIMMEQDIVLVLPNYRLGALGFLSTGDSFAPGNAGLKDQVLALKWVKQNIAAFGGNPNSVTIAGYGSSGVDVSLHLVSPLTGDLFHRAIIMSGSATTQKPLTTDQKPLALKQAKILGCPHNTSTNALNCLYTKSAEDFVFSFGRLMDENGSPSDVFTPVVEQESPENPEPFLTGQPADLIKAGKFHSVPVYIGLNKDEMGFLVMNFEEAAQKGNSQLYDETNKYWMKIAPKRFNYESGTPKSSKISEELRSFYLHDEPLKAGNYQGLAKLYADAWVGFGVYQLVKLLSQYSTQPVFYYHYVYEGCDTYARWSNGSHYGVSHYDEVLISYKVAARTHCEKDLALVNHANRLVTNFARTGTPTPSDDGSFSFTWEPTTIEHPQYLQFGLDTKMISGYVNEDRMNKWSQLFPLSSTSASTVHKQNDFLVQSFAGTFRGSILKTYNGKDIYSFRGIRYAIPPTGIDRFNEAIPVQSFNGVYDATKDGPSCPQPDFGSRIMSENCLYLNVYIPTLPQKSSETKANKPVIVFIHSGPFISSSGSSFEYGPDFLLNHDVILVTMNYRLGALGFLSTGDKKAPGNAGLKDQVLALKWVQQNIEEFGGDPNKVTLVGHGLGAWCASLHMVSPLSKGLFHNVLLSSGAATNQFNFPSDHKDLVIKQAAVLGCPHDTIDNAFNCLYTKTADEFSYSITSLAQTNGRPMFVWYPVVEEVTPENPEPFLPGQPADIIREGNANFVPVYIGVNKDEMGYLVIPAEEQAQHGSSEKYDALNNNWEELAPQYFGYEGGTPKSFNISRELKQFYLKNELLRAGHYQGLANLYADGLTGFQVHRMVNLLMQYSTEPVYYSHYLYEGCDTAKTWTNGTRFGVVHFDEMLLAFKVGGHPDHCEKDLERIGQALSFVENFARFGNPTPNEVKNYAVKWEPTTKEHPQYLQFGPVAKMVPGFINEERMKKWDELFPMTPATA